MNTDINKLQNQLDELIETANKLEMELCDAKSDIYNLVNEILKIQFGFRIGSVVKCNTGEYIVIDIINTDNDIDVKPWLVGIEKSSGGQNCIIHTHMYNSGDFV